MKTQRDSGYYGVIEYVTAAGVSLSTNVYKDSRGSLYKQEKTLLSALKRNTLWVARMGSEVTKVSIVKAVVNEEVLMSTVVPPDKLK